MGERNIEHLINKPRYCQSCVTFTSNYRKSKYKTRLNPFVHFMIITGWHFINTPCWHWKGGDPVTSVPGHCGMVMEVVYVRGGGHPTLSLQPARVHLSVSSDDNCRQRWIHGWIYINMSCFYFYSVEGRLRMGKYPPMLLRVLLVTSLLCSWSICSHLSHAPEQLPLPRPQTSS